MAFFICWRLDKSSPVISKLTRYMSHINALALSFSFYQGQPLPLLNQFILAIPRFKTRIAISFRS